MSLLTVSSYGRGAASTRVRLLDWVRHLDVPSTHHGYLEGSSAALTELVRQPGRVARAERDLRSLVRRAQHGPLVLSRRASPFSTGHLEADLLRSAHRGVYDFDDAIMLAPPGRRLGPTPAHVWRRSVPAADLVIAGNDYLANLSADAGRETIVIPSCVEPDDYTHAPPAEQPHDHPTAVWMGSPSTEQYLLDVSGALLAAHQDVGLRLRVVSSGTGSLGELDTMVERREWSLSTMARDLATADFGLMPLPDTPWTRGKCAYKLLQYGAASLPLVGSPVGANRQVLESAGGAAPTSLDEWTDVLRAFAATSPTERRAMGDRSRAAVRRHYSFAAWAPVWREAVGIA